MIIQDHMAPQTPGQVSSPVIAFLDQPSLTSRQLLEIVKVLHYAYPSVVFLYFIIALIATVCLLQTKSLRVKDEHVRRDLIMVLIAVLTSGYVRLSPLKILVQEY